MEAVQDEDDLTESFLIGPHLYLVEIVDHCVKVGITETPRDRLRAIEAMARKMGRRVGRVWMTPPHGEARKNEKLLKGLSRTEYLKEDFDQLIDRAMRLTMSFDEEADEDGAIDFARADGFVVPTELGFNGGHYGCR